MNAILKILVGLASIVIIAQGAWSGVMIYRMWTAQQEEARDAATKDCDAKVSVYISERTVVSEADVLECLRPLRNSAFFPIAMKRLADSGAPLDPKLIPEQ